MSTSTQMDDNVFGIIDLKNFIIIFIIFSSDMDAALSLDPMQQHLYRLASSYPLQTYNMNPLIRLLPRSINPIPDLIGSCRIQPTDKIRRLPISFRLVSVTRNHIGIRRA
jgi:hypothetical protein